MRVPPAGFRPSLRAQWLCAAVDLLLGEASLARVPALMSGCASVTDHPVTARFAPAAFALRQVGVEVGSEIHLRQAVHDAVIWEEEHRNDDDYEEPPYEIAADAAGYPFRMRAGNARKVDVMVAALTAGLGLRPWASPIADPGRRMVVRTAEAEGAQSLIVDMSGAEPPAPPPRHDLSRPARGPIVVPLYELEAIASRMDERDAAEPERARGNWLGRIREENGSRIFQVLTPDRASGTLPETEALHLDGIRHLIGLPGTGKTTLIILLLMWLDGNGYRAVVLLPSIEASLNLLGDLRFYGAEAGLLVGQSPQTRLDHARKFAERLGADGAHGFGRTAPGADLMALNCALAAFDSDEQGHDEAFPHLYPPCRQVYQRGLKRDGTERKEETAHLCPLAGWCGRMKASRDLTSRRIWIGHVLSMDTRIGPHFSDDQVRYFEAVAMASDLVIVDEADGAQAVLDRKAISSLDLTGSEQSYEHLLNRELFMPISSGRNDMTASNVQSYSAAASDFRKLNHSLVAQLQNDWKRNGTEGTMARFKDTFVTSASVLTAIFSAPDDLRLPPDARLAEDRKFSALRSFWDATVRAALFRRTDTDDGTDDYDFDSERIAREVGTTPEEVDASAVRIAALVRDWISEPLPTRRETMLDEARDVMFGFVPPQDSLAASERNDLFRFLVGVSTVIFQFLALVPAQQAMVAEGIHHEPLFRQGISEDLGRTVPEALIGRLSGVRCHQDDSAGRSSVRIQYVTFRGAPRILLYRLHELLRHEGRPSGPTVLLASATSYLLESPTFHIPTGPDLVLRRAGDDAGWRDSEFLFAPPPDPRDPSARLRFSGSPLAQRERVLGCMADHYFSGDEPLAVRMCRDFDPGRKVGFVVNSYEQVRQFKRHLERTRPDLARRVVGVTDRMPERNDGDWITAAQVERLGQRTDWTSLVFPMKALSRGVNIVFEQGARRRDALLGTIVFLTRPHPATESLDLVAGLAGAGTLAFDSLVFPPGASTAQMAAQWAASRRGLMATSRRLLRFPLMASRLGPLAVPFTADMMVDILQTIGRAMRNGVKTRVIFADAAWAPRSAEGLRDSRQTSMLVMMRDILRNRVNDPDPVDREIYRCLYEPFLAPLERCANVLFPDGAEDDD
jgi:hypothetical protein